MSLPPLSFSRLALEDVPAAFALEEASYPADEAATFDKLRMRQAQAGEFFYGGYSTDGLLKAFVCGTLTADDTLTEDSMSTHEPSGKTLCIHSVVTASEMRRQGVGSWMMKAYVAKVAEETRVRRILLLCKTTLIGFYEGAGFTNLGESDVEHGSDVWMLMEQRLS